jgi:hypothetical protein
LQYIEVQEADPGGRPLQRWIASVLDGDARWCGWSVAVPDLTFAASTGIAIARVDQRGAGDGFGRWSFAIAGGDRMRSSNGVAPYFIRYDHTAAEHEAILRDRVQGDLRASLGGFAEVLVGDPGSLLGDWLAPVGGAVRGVVVDPRVGVEGVARVRIVRDGGVADVDPTG